MLPGTKILLDRGFLKIRHAASAGNRYQDLRCRRPLDAAQALTYWRRDRYDTHHEDGVATIRSRVAGGAG